MVLEVVQFECETGSKSVRVDLPSTDYVVLFYYQQRRSRRSSRQFPETRPQQCPVEDCADANLRKSIPVTILLYLSH